MVTMGFPKDEITDSLQSQKYDEVMATYLLLGRKAPEVSLFDLRLIDRLHHRCIECSESCDHIRLHVAVRRERASG